MNDLGTHRTASSALPVVLAALLSDGDATTSRNGRTRELSPAVITLDHWDDPVPYITAPGRRASLPAQVAETMWILAGRNDIEWLSLYLPRAAEFSDDGLTWRGGYGPRLRNFGAEHHPDGVGVDQLAHVIKLLQDDPNTRRAVIQIYDPVIDAADGKDVPCNNWLHFTLRDGELNLLIATRSNDAFWGWSGINAFEWTVLQTLIARILGVTVGQTTFCIGSLHLYERHWDRAGGITTGGEKPLNSSPMPQRHQVSSLEELDRHVEKWFAIEAKLRENPWQNNVGALINSHPERMMRSWLWVVWGYLTGEMDYAMNGYRNTALYTAALASPKRKQPNESDSPAEPKAEWIPVNPLVEQMVALHAEKNAVYGDSWRKRGELLSILPNIARKVDRLGAAGAGDTEADTLMDLCIYASKYTLWLCQQSLANSNAGAQSWLLGGFFEGSRPADPDDPEAIATFLRRCVGEQVDKTPDRHKTPDTWFHKLIQDELDRICELAEDNPSPGDTNACIAKALHIARWAYVLLKRAAWAAGNEKRQWQGYDQ